MIKIGKLYIHLLTGALFLAAFLTKTLTQTAISYIIIVLHEFSHYIAAKKYGIKVQGIVIMPFGVSLRLKDKMIDDPLCECMICAAGPLSNGALIIIALFLTRFISPVYEDLLLFFIYTNFSLLIINTIPIIPLDGGRIVRSYLTHKLGFIKASKISRTLSQLNIACVGLLGLYVLYVSKFNVSLTLLCAFLLFNMSIEKRNDELTVMRQIVYSKEKLYKRKIMKVRYYAATYDAEIKRLLKSFSYDNYYFVNIVDEKCSFLGVLSETQIINGLSKGKKTLEEIFF